MLGRREKWKKTTGTCKSNWEQILKPGELSGIIPESTEGASKAADAHVSPAGQRARGCVRGRASVETAAGLGPAGEVPGVRKPLGHHLENALRKPHGAAARGL